MNEEEAEKLVEKLFNSLNNGSTVIADKNCNYHPPEEDACKCEGIGTLILRDGDTVKLAVSFCEAHAESFAQFFLTSVLNRTCHRN